MFFRNAIITLALLLAFPVVGFTADDDIPGRVNILSQGSNQLPRDLFPPELLPPPRLNEEERLTIERARADMTSESPERRAGAVMLLGKYEHPSAREPVITALQDPAARVRRAALVSVMEWNRNAPGDAVIPVLNLVGDDDPDIRRTASSAVPTMMTLRRTYELIRPNSHFSAPLPKDTVTILSNAFLDEDPVVRRNMVNNAYAVGIDIPGTTWLTLLDDPDRQVRLGAIPLAARMASQVDFLNKAVEIAQREDRTERLVLAREIAMRGTRDEYQEILVTLSEDTNDEVASEALLGRLRFDPKRGLMQASVQRVLERRMTQEQAYRFFRLIRIAPDEVIPYLPSLISLEDATLRQEAITAYLDFGLANSKPEVLTGFLNDRSPEIRQTVVNYIGSAPNRLTPALVQTMLESDHADLRSGLIEISGQLPEEQASDLLFDLLLDESIDIRARALLETVRRQLPGWPKVLGASLRDPDFQLQRQALALIFKYPFPGDHEALLAFIKAYPDSPLVPLIRARMESGQFNSDQET